MTQPRQAQLDLLLSISEGLSRGSYEMLRVSPTDAMHAPSCGLAIRDAVEELRWMRAENERLREALVLGSEVLASHQGSPQREWHSGGAWLYPGDSINVVRAPLPEIKVEP